MNDSGPSISMDTGCAASLTAFHCALQDLRMGLCDDAIVGGTQLCLKPQTCLLYYRAGALSDDGITRAYDHKGETTAVYICYTDFQFGARVSVSVKPLRRP